MVLRGQRVKCQVPIFLDNKAAFLAWLEVVDPRVSVKYLCLLDKALSLPVLVSD